MTTTEAEPLRDLVHELARELQADRCTLFTVDQANREVWSKIAIGLEIPEIRLPMHRGMVGYVARTGRLLNLKDAYNDPRFDRSVDAQTGYRTRSALTSAVLDPRSRVIGVLQALNKDGGAFTPQDEEMMRQYCQRAAELLAAG